MKDEFKMYRIEQSLKELLKDSVINKEQLDNLLEKYKKDSRDIFVIVNEIKQLRFDQKKLQELLQKDELILDKEASTIDMNKKADYTLSLENVTDFEKDGKQYIEIHYPYPYDEVRVIENMDPHRTGKERFEELQGTQKIMSTNGVTNATSIFEQSLLRDCHEVKMTDIKDVKSVTEYNKLSSKEQEIVYGTLMAMIASLDVEKRKTINPASADIETLLDIFGKKISLSPEENVVIISTPNSPSEDEIKTLKVDIARNEKGEEITKYSLTPLNSKGYQYNGEEAKEQSDDGLSQENEEKEKDKEDDLEKELGPAYTLKRKKKWKEAAFINVLWFIIFCGVLAGVISASIIFKLM